jgi:hypothetical protein
VRYSASAITTVDTWNSATAVTTGVPVPQAAGQVESMVVSGLTPGATYYFAVRAEDEEPNLGDLAPSSPSAMAKQPTPMTAGMYDDRHSGWTYVGTWGPITTTGPYQKTFTYTSTVQCGDVHLQWESVQTVLHAIHQPGPEGCLRR